MRKSPDLILDLRRLVYDNDHPAKDITAPEQQRWRPEGSAWKESNNRGFHHAADGHEIQHVAYRHLRRDHGGKPSLITDILGYNSSVARWGGDSENWVGDLLLECEVKIEKAEGTFLLEVVRAGERFQAVWDLLAGDCELRRIDKDEKSEVLGRLKASLPTGTHLLRLANVDDRLTVWVDDALPFGEGIAYQSPKLQRPTALDLSPARIGAKGATLSVQRIKLFRDTYFSYDAGRSDVKVADWDDPREWEGLAELPVRTMYVQPRHYYVLGDNPSGSADSRHWGLVPERLLLGKPVLLYYPWSRVRALR